MNEWLMNLFADMTLFSGLAVAIITGAVWVISRTSAHQGQIKGLETKIDHLDEKMDRGFKHLENKIDSAIKHMDEKMTGIDRESKERISRLEKYFDIIMSTHIKRNNDQLKMEG